ncbi:histidine phosphatase family protein [Aestuariirhabdus sp. Z084]|uniref:SixA phosphatase family protein n=1 Tax=Aestuariirhabdus haliotis TaxID=2918751 RepID=UPI00201B3E48|nr:histidine phosphatase family protein [Aestuariirhabdus haliotis]MCL6414534.1 histidine phosphatase family protein [Aestuariirhabdus haliotis]MCL6418484.1 histidine phosphatase family protein [Aestuariirhabdus haliotis]
MKQLLILRHAKSSWSHPGLPDIERPLNKRGERVAPLMAGWIYQQFPQLSLILSSPANRALTTAHSVMNAYSHRPKLEVEHSLFHASAHQILQVIIDYAETQDCIMTVGHNPGLESFVSSLDADFCDPIPTAALVVIDCDISDWSELKQSECQVHSLYLPRQLFSKP